MYLYNILDSYILHLKLLYTIIKMEKNIKLEKYKISYELCQKFLKQLESKDNKTEKISKHHIKVVKFDIDNNNEK